VDHRVLAREGNQGVALVLWIFIICHKDPAVLMKPLECISHITQVSIHEIRPPCCVAEFEEGLESANHLWGNMAFKCRKNDLSSMRK
jgi:hypothetical protein